MFQVGTVLVGVPLGLLEVRQLVSEVLLEGTGTLLLDVTCLLVWIPILDEVKILSFMQPTLAPGTGDELIAGLFELTEVHRVLSVPHLLIVD